MILLVAAPAARAQIPRPFADLGRYLSAESSKAPSLEASIQTTTAGSSSIEQLGARLRPGSVVSVRVADEREIVGTFSSVSARELVLTVSGAPLVIAAEDVREVVARQGTDRALTGLFVGGFLGALIGSGSCYDVPASANETTPSCAPVVIGVGAAGGLLGWKFGASRTRPAIVYRASGPPRPGADTMAASASARSLAIVRSRVKPFERVYVTLRGGQALSGEFRDATATALHLDINDAPRRIGTGDVLRVTRRGETRGRRGMLVGGLAGAAVGGLLFATAPAESGDWTLADRAAAGTILGGATGAMYGGLIGLVWHHRVLVYDADRVLP